MPPKPAWEWSDGERIAALADDAGAVRRLDAGKGWWNSNGGGVRPHNRIDGSVDPHLFFAWELFDSTIALAFAEDARTRQAWQASKDEARQRLGLPNDMWERLAQISEPYLDARRREREIALSTIPVPQRGELLRNLAPVLCRERYNALTRADVELGPAFRVFLYTAVAAEQSSLILRKRNPQTLASISRGCA